MPVPLRPGPVAEPGAHYDVAILGSHLIPGMLATILARHGVRVLLVDAPGDRTLPSGDSTVPYTTAVFQLIAERFDTPEFGAFAHFVDLPEWVRRSSGIKKSLAFLYHSPGRWHDPEETVQFHVPGEHNEWHLYRPDVDEYARQLAEARGTHVVSGRPVVDDVQLDEGEVVVRVADGQAFRASYVIDACGMDSPLLGSLGVARRPGELRLCSRSITTHMTGVRPFEQVVRLTEYHRATPFSAGTVHHLFDGGWLQVVDFANHDGAAGNRCGVTLAFDPDRYPDLPAEPEEAFWRLIERFPSIKEQFADATANRPWVTDNPWQRISTPTHGARWFALERSSVRTDEFLSRDVTVGAEMVHALAAVLLRVVRGTVEAGPEFARIAGYQDALIVFNDQMLACARIACRDFRLWNAYSRVWLLWQILAHLSLKRATADAAADPAGTWRQVEEFASGALWFRTPDGLRQLLDWFFRQFERVRAGEQSDGVTADRIFRRLRHSRFVPPLYRFGDPNARYYHFTLPRRLLMLAWVKTIAPADFKRLLSRDNVTGRRSVDPAAAPSAAPSGPPSAGSRSEVPDSAWLP